MRNSSRAPVPEAFCDSGQFRIVGEHCTALTHRDVVGRVKTQRPNVSKRPHFSATIGRAKGITAVFNQPKSVVLAQGGDHVQVERVAQRVGQHDGFGSRRNRRFYFVGVNVIRLKLDIDKNRHSAKLQDRIDGRWKAGGNPDDFVTLSDGSLAQQGTGQRTESHQIGR